LRLKDVTKFSVKEFNELIKTLMHNRFNGKVDLEINMHQGGITTVRLNTSAVYKKINLIDRF